MPVVPIQLCVHRSQEHQSAYMKSPSHRPSNVSVLQNAAKHFNTRKPKQPQFSKASTLVTAFTGYFITVLFQHPVDTDHVQPTEKPYAACLEIDFVKPDHVLDYFVILEPTHGNFK